VSVRVLLTSGTHRLIEKANAARAKEAFFEIVCHEGDGRDYVLLTLRTADVVMAEILKGDIVVDRVPGGGSRPA